MVLLFASRGVSSIPRITASQGYSSFWETSTCVSLRRWPRLAENPHPTMAPTAFTSATQSPDLAACSATPAACQQNRRIQRRREHLQSLRQR
ncbi:hypothetical protein WJX72_009720 [[Myrmecia] bisecta]|uniref:Uncharacterized protein n=1 Tax=[Myrmecia] bisecta TaxID=41462 RepID=A0AAW1PNF5_9CHLO